MATEADYGSSHYRQFEPLNKRQSGLRVEAGTNKPARVKQQPQRTQRAGLGFAGNQSNRKDKWVRYGTNGQVSHPLVQATEQTTAISEESYDNADILYDNGEIDYETYSQMYDNIDSHIDEDNSNVIS